MAGVWPAGKELENIREISRYLSVDTLPVILRISSLNQIEMALLQLG